jgi:hypothetical protein
MNPSYFTEEHQLFREFKRFFTKEVAAHRKWEKREQLNASYGKVREIFFGINYPRYSGLNLDLFYTVIFLENFKRLNHLVAAMWAHSYLAMTHLNAETKELARLFSAKYR